MSSDSDAEMHPGRCDYHGGHAEDVVLVTVVEAGSGPGGGTHACLPCARPLVHRRDASAWFREQVAAMEDRAATGAAR